MSLLDWMEYIPPNIDDQGLKLLIYLLLFFAILTSIIVHFTTKREKKTKSGLSLEELDFDISQPISDIDPEERIEILNIEKTKFVAARRALTDSYKRKKLSDSVFERLSLRYAADLKKIEDEIERTEKEAEVSQLEEELKKMQGDYLSKITGEKEVETPQTTPSTTPPSAPSQPTTPPPSSSPSVPSTTTPPKTETPKGQTPKVQPPGGIPAPKPTPVKTPQTPPPSQPTPTPTPAPAPTTSASTPSQQEGEEGDLFAKSTSIAALRKEMLKELDRLKAFMSEQNK